MKQNQSLQQNLLKWYRKHRRKLPWRETKNPYHIWVSEIMLQQTRVETVIPYYQNFIETFPTVNHLANAPEHDVLKKWQGLGYYRRAKLIHKAAKEVATTYNGALPSTQTELRNLSGFGPYTSGAVASIAFNKPVSAVDGNVKRVLSRIFATSDSVESFADELAKNDSPSDWTQALMELGAMICLPKNPKCLLCPVRENCKAFQTQTVEFYPPASVKTKVKEIYAWAWMIEDSEKNKILIQQRPHSGRWAGMWEFPTIESDKKPPSPLSPLKFTFRETKNVGGFVHQLTHQTIHVKVVHAKTHTQIKLKDEQKWVTHSKLSDFPISKMQQRAFELFTSKF